MLNIVKIVYKLSDFISETNLISLTYFQILNLNLKYIQKIGNQMQLGQGYT